MASLLSFSLPKPTLPRVATASFPSTAADFTSTSTSSLIESLDQKFGRRGIKFAESGDVPIVELSVRNGSSVNLRIPDAHVTSYKPKVYWKDDGFEEILYTTTTPAAGNNGASANAADSRARGGIGVVINEVPEANPKVKVKGGAGGGGGGGSLLADSEWFVKNSDSDSFDAVQVELGCTCGKLDITYVVSLYPLSVATAVIVQNNGPKPINLTSAILTHFRFKRRRGAGATDLKGCSFTAYPPLPSPFEILSPLEAMKADDPGWFSFGSEPVAKPGVWAQQEEMITVLKHKLSRVYGAPPVERTKSFHRSAPSKYEIIDQGRELFFRVIRMGYEEIYLSSPGSFSKKYGNDYFVCTGPASILVPVTVNPGEEWRGAQVIEHDNL